MSCLFLYAKIILFIYIINFNNAQTTDDNCGINLDLLKLPNITRLEFKSCIKAYNSTLNFINNLIPLKDGKILTVNDKVNMRVFNQNKNNTIVKDIYSIFDSVILLKDGRIAYSNAKNESINIYILDQENYEIAESYSTPVQNVTIINFMAQLANGWIVTISSDDGLRVWDSRNSMKLLYTRINDYTKDISSVVAVSNGDFITHSTIKNQLLLWETSDQFKSPIGIVQTHEEYAYTNLNEIDEYIAGASLNLGLVLLEKNKAYFSDRHLSNNHTGDVLGTTVQLPTGIIVNGLTFSLSNNSLSFWDLNTQNIDLLENVQGLGRVSKIAKTKNGDLLIATGKGEIIIWEYNSGFGKALIWIVTVFAATLLLSLAVGIFICKIKKNSNQERNASLLRTSDV